MITAHHIAAALAAVSLTNGPAAHQNGVPGVVPKPAGIETRPGHFTITPKTIIGVDSVTEKTGRYLAAFLEPATGFRLEVRAAERLRNRTNTLLLVSASGKPRLGEEGYRLVVRPDEIHVEANTSAGAFYACQTLRQLLPPEIESASKAAGVEWRIPCVEIEDVPRFAWRGGLLDSGRHFWDKSFVKRFIDLLALHKLNRFHWHLTDDQGWRVQITAYPRLTDIGAWRHSDGRTYGGYYTKDELREIVAYAESRHVMIVPEIEMPGHTRAALAAYPELSCTGKQQPVATKWGVFEDIYCAGSEKVYEYIETMLGEVVDIFPAPYIHVGGDECPRKRWQECPKCRQRIQSEGLKSEHELHGYFMRRVEAILRKKGRTLIAWDEILEGGLPPDAIVQSWRGMQGGLTAAKSGHQVIMSPTTHCYLDYDYATISLRHAYSFEPTAGDLTDDQKKRVLGIEGNMWTEHTPTPADVDRQVFPRLCALAEVGWSAANSRDWRDFSSRLDRHLKRLDQLKVGYHRGP